MFAQKYFCANCFCCSKSLSSIFSLRELPRTASNKEEDWRHQLRSRDYIEARHKALTDAKVMNKSRGDMPPPVVFHAEMTDKDQLRRLVKLMLAEEDSKVAEGDRLYLTACNHNYLSDIDAYATLKNRGEPEETIKEFLYFPCYVMAWPGKRERAENIKLIRAVSDTTCSYRCVHGWFDVFFLVLKVGNKHQLETSNVAKTTELEAALRLWKMIKVCAVWLSECSSSGLMFQIVAIRHHSTPRKGAPKPAAKSCSRRRGPSETRSRAPSRR